MHCKVKGTTSVFPHLLFVHSRAMMLESLRMGLTWPSQLGLIAFRVKILLSGWIGKFGSWLARVTAIHANSYPAFARIDSTESNLIYFHLSPTFIKEWSDENYTLKVKIVNQTTIKYSLESLTRECKLPLPSYLHSSMAGTVVEGDRKSDAQLFVGLKSDDWLML